MKLINQSYEILGTPKSLYEAWNFVAMAARNCYQSHKSKPDESEEQFCRRLLLKHEDDLECDHLSPFEFGIIYLTLESNPSNCFSTVKHDNIGFTAHYNWNDVVGAIGARYRANHFSRVYSSYKDNKHLVCVTTNLRVILENHWEEDLKYAGKPTEHHVKACCFKMITNRAVMAEITRHRTLSFCIESTRYCNYSKDKFGNELAFIEPCWSDFTETSAFNNPKSILEANIVSIRDIGSMHLKRGLNIVEKIYFSMLESGWQPQQAATILPNALKTTIMMCGYEDNLQHMFRLRAEECSGPVHPQMAEIMKPMYESYKQWLND